MVWYLCCMSTRVTLGILALVVFGGAILVFSVLPGLQKEAQLQPKGVLRGTVEVTLTDQGYVPSLFTIAEGTEVVFSTERTSPHWPASNLHPTHEQYPEFDPGKPVAAGETWSFVFTELGAWHFHDHIRSYYTGTIHVVAE